MNSKDKQMCNPEQQAIDRAIAETDEERIARVAQACDRIPTDRLMDMVNAYINDWVANDKD